MQSTTPGKNIDIDRVRSIVGSLVQNVQKVILGKQAQINQAVACWIAKGHLLIEDVPGTGKTILARALAGSANVPFSRVQFTPDLLPGDIIGASIFRQDQSKFTFIPGPLFTTVLLADEINRATPRTQSALLEAMSEGQITAEGHTYKLDDTFFCIATQNPIDQLGTFTLPEAQLDRFMVKLSLGYPPVQEEIKMLRDQNEKHPILSLKAIIEHQDLIWLTSRWRESIDASASIDSRQRRVPNERSEEGSPTSHPRTLAPLC
jgi:MoxR-like ATPase